MHQIIVIKAWGGDADEASSDVSCALEDSIDPKQNTCGWDYVGDVTLITKPMLQPEFGVSSYAELEKKMLQRRLNSMNSLIKGLRNDLLPIIAPQFMTKNDAVLCVGNDYLKKHVEKTLKRKRDIKRPDTFETISEVILNLLVSIAKKDTGHSMMMWRMGQIKKLQYCFTDPHSSNTLQCSENPYAELPCDNKRGLSPYFFTGDRHL
jgi:hypothetical protein